MLEIAKSREKRLIEDILGRIHNAPPHPETANFHLNRESIKALLSDEKEFARTHQPELSPFARKLENDLRGIFEGLVSDQDEIRFNTAVGTNASHFELMDAWVEVIDTRGNREKASYKFSLIYGGDSRRKSMGDSFIIDKDTASAIETGSFFRDARGVYKKILEAASQALAKQLKVNFEDLDKGLQKPRRRRIVSGSHPTLSQHPDA